MQASCSTLQVKMRSTVLAQTHTQTYTNSIGKNPERIKKRNNKT
jgi:hypothetical protein